MPNRVTAADMSAAESTAPSSWSRERSVVILDAETLEIVGFDSVPSRAPTEVECGGGVERE